MPDITSDTARSGAPQHDTGELRHTLSIHDVEAQFAAAGVQRSHRQVLRFCASGLLDAVKIPGPTGVQWYVATASVPKAIGDLEQWDAQRRAATQSDMSNHVTLEKPLNSNVDTASHGTPEPAVSDKEINQKGTETEPVTARHGTTELDIFEHPYVKRLEGQVEKWENKYHDQVRRTEDIQLASQKQIIELQRMTAIGQSETLADFMLKARNLVFGPSPEPEKREVETPTG